MKVLRSLEEARAARLEHPVVTLGTFDGVHVGHRLVLRHVVNLARERAADAVVVTFARHPRAIIEGRAPAGITSLEHRLELFADIGLDATLVLTFDEELRAMSARDFAIQVFKEALQAELVLLGYNNRFGRGGEGDLALLEKIGREVGFEAQRLDEVRLGATPVSSTEIREAVRSGDLERAALMLGRPFTLSGVVRRGDGLGRRIGFPTANLEAEHGLRPPPGVYGVRGRHGRGENHGLLHLGPRPSVRGSADAEAERIEVHLLDFDEDLYGERLEVAFLVHLRGLERFDDLEALGRAIAADRERFLAWMARR